MLTTSEHLSTGKKRSNEFKIFKTNNTLRLSTSNYDSSNRCACSKWRGWRRSCCPKCCESCSAASSSQICDLWRMAFWHLSTISNFTEPTRLLGSWASLRGKLNSANSPPFVSCSKLGQESRNSSWTHLANSLLPRLEQARNARADSLLSLTCKTSALVSLRQSWSAASRIATKRSWISKCHPRRFWDSWSSSVASRRRSCSAR